MRRTLLLTVALSVVAAWPAGAQQLKVDFHDGRVTVDATSVPVRTILTEWGKVGGTKIVGAERITGAPMTVKLVNVTEAQALEIDPAQRRRLHGGAAQRRRRRVDVRPHPRDGDDVRAAAAGASRAPGAAATEHRVQRHAAFRSAAPAAANRPNRTKRTSRMRIRRTRRSSRSRSQGQNGFPNQPGQFQPGAPAGHDRQPATAQTITINPAQPRPAQPQAPIGVSQPGMMVQPPPAADSDAGHDRPPAGRSVARVQ